MAWLDNFAEPVKQRLLQVDARFRATHGRGIIPDEPQAPAPVAPEQEESTSPKDWLPARGTTGPEVDLSPEPGSPVPPKPPMNFLERFARTVLPSGASLYDKIQEQSSDPHTWAGQTHAAVMHTGDILPRAFSLKERARGWEEIGKQSAEQTASDVAESALFPVAPAMPTIAFGTPPGIGVSLGKETIGQVAEPSSKPLEDKVKDALWNTVAHHTSNEELQAETGNPKTAFGWNPYTVAENVAYAAVPAVHGAKSFLERVAPDSRGLATSPQDFAERGINAPRGEGRIKPVMAGGVDPEQGGVPKSYRLAQGQRRIAAANADLEKAGADLAKAEADLEKAQTEAIDNPSEAADAAEAAAEARYDAANEVHDIAFERVDRQTPLDESGIRGTSLEATHRMGVEQLKAMGLEYTKPPSFGESPKSITPATLTQEISSDPGYLYHATNEERLFDIAETGKLHTHRPSDFTDQTMWPDGSTEKRAYFSPSAKTTWQFSPENGRPVVVRTKAGPGFMSESTGDIYSKKPVDASRLEYLGDDNHWHPVRELSQKPPSFLGRVKDAAVDQWKEEVARYKAEPERGSFGRRKGEEGKPGSLAWVKPEVESRPELVANQIKVQYAINGQRNSGVSRIVDPIELEALKADPNISLSQEGERTLSRVKFKPELGSQMEATVTPEGLNLLTQKHQIGHNTAGDLRAVSMPPIPMKSIQELPNGRFKVQFGDAMELAGEKIVDRPTLDALLKARKIVQPEGKSISKEPPKVGNLLDEIQKQRRDVRTEPTPTPVTWMHEKKPVFEEPPPPTLDLTPPPPPVGGYDTTPPVVRSAIETFKNQPKQKRTLSELEYFVDHWAKQEGGSNEETVSTFKTLAKQIAEKRGLLSPEESPSSAPSFLDQVAAQPEPAPSPDVTPEMRAEAKRLFDAGATPDAVKARIEQMRAQGRGAGSPPPPEPPVSAAPDPGEPPPDAESLLSKREAELRAQRRIEMQIPPPPDKPNPLAATQTPEETARILHDAELYRLERKQQAITDRMKAQTAQQPPPGAIPPEGAPPAQPPANAPPGAGQPPPAQPPAPPPGGQQPGMPPNPGRQKFRSGKISVRELDFLVRGEAWKEVLYFNAAHEDLAAHGSIDPARIERAIKPAMDAFRVELAKIQKGTTPADRQAMGDYEMLMRQHNQRPFPIQPQLPSALAARQAALESVYSRLHDVHAPATERFTGQPFPKAPGYVGADIWRSDVGFLPDAGLTPEQIAKIDDAANGIPPKPPAPAPGAPPAQPPVPGAPKVPPSPTPVVQDMLPEDKWIRLYQANRDSVAHDAWVESGRPIAAAEKDSKAFVKEQSAAIAPNLRKLNRQQTINVASAFHGIPVPLSPIEQVTLNAVKAFDAKIKATSGQLGGQQIGLDLKGAMRTGDMLPDITKALRREGFRQFIKPALVPVVDSLDVLPPMLRQTLAKGLREVLSMPDWSQVEIAKILDPNIAKAFGAQNATAAILNSARKLQNLQYSAALVGNVKSINQNALSSTLTFAHVAAETNPIQASVSFAKAGVQLTRAIASRRKGAPNALMRELTANHIMNAGNEFADSVFLASRGLKRGVEGVKRYGTYPWMLVEDGTRAHGYLMAKDAYLAKGIPEVQAQLWAIEAVEKTQGLYEAMARGPVTRSWPFKIFGQYGQWSENWLEYMAKAVLKHDAQAMRKIAYGVAITTLGYVATHGVKPRQGTTPFSEGIDYATGSTGSSPGVPYLTNLGRAGYEELAAEYNVWDSLRKQKSSPEQSIMALERAKKHGSSFLDRIGATVIPGYVQGKRTAQAIMNPSLSPVETGIRATIGEVPFVHKPTVTSMKAQLKVNLLSDDKSDSMRAQNRQLLQWLLQNKLEGFKTEVGHMHAVRDLRESWSK